MYPLKNIIRKFKNEIILRFYNNKINVFSEKNIISKKCSVFIRVNSFIRVKWRKKVDYSECIESYQIRFSLH